MARSSRRRRRRRPSASKANPRSYSELRAGGQHEDSRGTAPPSRPEAASEPLSASPSQTPKQASGPLRSNQANWKAEYRDVFSDLRHLLIVSVTLFGVMLVVGFLL